MVDRYYKDCGFTEPDWCLDTLTVMASTSKSPVVVEFGYVRRASEVASVSTLGRIGSFIKGMFNG